MSQKNETPALIVALLLTALLLGGGGWLLFNRFFQSGVPGVASSDGQSGNSSEVTPDRFSDGTQLLDPSNASPEKQAGIAAIGAGNFEQAVQDLTTSLQVNRNDPEALIYLNNAQIGQQKSYTIAVAVPMATSLSTAQEILRGVAQSQAEVNRAGGINGVPLKVKIASDDSSPALAPAVARSLIEDGSVLGVVGHFSSGASLAAGEVYQQGGLVMISPTSTAVQLSNLGDFVFRTVPSDRFSATTLSRYMLTNLQRRNAAIFFDSSSQYSLSLKEEFTTAVANDGGQVVADFDLNNPGFSASNAIEQARRQGAEVLVLLSSSSVLNLALQVVTVNQRKLPLLAGDDLYDPKTLEVGGAAAEGMVVAVPWILLADPNSAFAQQSRQFWGGDVNWRTAMAYDAAQVLITGLKQNPTRQGIQQTLTAPNFSLLGATGTVRFLSSGDRSQPMQLVTVKPGTRSGYEFDFVPVTPSL
ncbi:ABC transporter substrate-binding protein [Leptolyngbya sp. FACHB-711]|uniref:ABC transporter substrate-binding protein n=1 Tax=unclassified Leptolyngbya TaxID=2650499 RepID=UPI00168877B3|nr:ABC transporter substrate-binding protein [Leptolyngbya sp. FACHB-711]MBD1851169.1 amino acid ABC transporter substrate-binding protein [Cyanobacteria bacterium FACHB-502]MBD2023055.1 amino acid ABC transporter substrate-binding protein [Leptolyngbya sp. FACHB-711]